MYVVWNLELLVPIGLIVLGGIVAESFMPASSDDRAKVHLNFQILDDSMADVTSAPVNTFSNGHAFLTARTMAREESAVLWQ